MKVPNTKAPAGDLIVLVGGQAGGLGECVIRQTGETVTLGDRTYGRYQIVEPRGFESEEILHPLDQGPAGLLGTVFSTLAFGGVRQWTESLRDGE
jgi:hypothetical protein